MRLWSRTGVGGACVRSRAAHDGAQALAVRRRRRATAIRLLAGLLAVSPPITYAANSGGSADKTSWLERLSSRSSTTDADLRMSSPACGATAVANRHLRAQRSGESLEQLLPGTQCIRKLSGKGDDAVREQRVDDLDVGQFQVAQRAKNERHAKLLLQTVAPCLKRFAGALLEIFRERSSAAVRTARARGSAPKSDQSVKPTRVRTSSGLRTGLWPKT